MTFETHKKYGQVFGVAAMPLVVTTSVMNIPSMGELVGNSESVWALVVSLLLFTVIAYKGALFGAQFPDLDIKGSRADQNYKIAGKLMRMFGVTHRGKFSHDYIVQLLFWGLIAFGVTQVPVEGVLMEAVMAYVFVYVVFVYVGVFSHLSADAMTADGVWFMFFKVRFMPVAIRRINILGFKPFKSWFTTASAWNEINYKMMAVLLPLTVIIVGYVMYTNFLVDMATL